MSENNKEKNNGCTDENKEEENMYATEEQINELLISLGIKEKL